MRDDRRLRPERRGSSVVFLFPRMRFCMLLHRRWNGAMIWAAIGIAGPSLSALRAQQANDAAYTAKIRELTPTDPRWKFTTELVDHLPASSTVPTPLKVL